MGTGNKAILTGDFHAKHVPWNSVKNNAASCALINHYYKQNYVISTPSHPLHFPDGKRAVAGPRICHYQIIQYEQ
jgi:hypothetical protein